MRSIPLPVTGECNTGVRTITNNIPLGSLYKYTITNTTPPPPKKKKRKQTFIRLLYFVLGVLFGDANRKLGFGVLYFNTFFGLGFLLQLLIPEKYILFFLGLLQR